MVEAFNPERGPIADKSVATPERDAISNLFAGAIVQAALYRRSAMPEIASTRIHPVPALRAVPAGSLGRAYHEFMVEEDLSAEGLVAQSQIPRPAMSDDVTWFRERSREMHDLLHIVAGYGRDPLGEACVTAFSFAQTGLKGF